MDYYMGELFNYILWLSELFKVGQPFKRRWKVSSQNVWLRHLFAMKSLHLPEYETFGALFWFLNCKPYAYALLGFCEAAVLHSFVQNWALVTKNALKLNIWVWSVLGFFLNWISS